MLLLALSAAVAPSNNEDVRLLYARYAACLVAGQPSAAAEYVLALEPGALGASKMRNALPLERCWQAMTPAPGGQLQIAYDPFRYALADALIDKELLRSPVPQFERVPPLPHVQLRPPAGVPGRSRPLSENALKSAATSRYGECVVRTDPNAAQALLSTRPRSSAESDQLAAMSAALQSCLPRNASLPSDVLHVRGTIALNYYRLSKAAQASNGSGERQ
jgi:hypothetical protein